jgi:AraC-like DNA-binding protein
MVRVVLSAGFSDQGHFTKTFRRRMQMTPGEFRRHFRALERDHAMFRRDKIRAESRL